MEFNIGANWNAFKFMLRSIQYKWRSSLELGRRAANRSCEIKSQNLSESYGQEVLNLLCEKALTSAEKSIHELHHQFRALVVRRCQISTPSTFHLIPASSRKMSCMSRHDLRHGFRHNLNYHLSSPIDLQVESPVKAQVVSGVEIPGAIQFLFSKRLRQYKKSLVWNRFPVRRALHEIKYYTFMSVATVFLPLHSFVPLHFLLPTRTLPHFYSFLRFPSIIPLHP